MRCAVRFAIRRGIRSHWRLGDDQVAEYHRDGFTIGRGVLTAPEVDLLRDFVTTDQSLKEVEFALEDESGGNRNISVWSKPAGTTGNFARSERMVRAWEALLGGDVLLYHSKTLVKEPGKGGTWEWHQDYGYWYKDFFPRPAMGTTLLALTPVTEHNGGPRMLVGSHKMGRVNHETVGQQQGADPLYLEWALGYYESRWCELEPGDALFLHCNTFHNSKPNEHTEPRVMLGVAYTRNDNVALKNPYLPCHTVYPTLADDELLSEGHVSIQPGDMTALTPETGTLTVMKEGDEWSDVAVEAADGGKM